MLAKLNLSHTQFKIASSSSRAMSPTQFITSPPLSLKAPNSSLFFSTTTSTIHTHKISTLPFSFRTCTNSQFFSTRRLFLPSVSGIWDAITGGGNNPREAVAAIRCGMVLFRQVVTAPQFEFKLKFKTLFGIGSLQLCYCQG